MTHYVGLFRIKRVIS